MKKSVDNANDLRLVRNFFDAVSHIMEETGWSREKAERVLSAMYDNEPKMRKKLQEPRKDDGQLEEM